MEKILKLFGLGPVQYKLNDYGTNFYMHFVYEYIFDVFLLILDVVFAITSKQYTFALIVFAAVLLLALYQTFIVYTAKCGKISIIEGQCIEYDKSVKRVMKTQIFGKSNITIKVENMNYVVPVSHTAGYKKGSIVRVFCMPNAIYPKDEDTINIPSPIYVCKVRNTTENDVNTGNESK